MPTTKLVLASILKPVDDTRMYEKLGLSLVETNKYEINIIGFSTKNAANPEPIIWHPLFDFKRNSLKRWFAPLRFLRKIIKVKPKVVIVNTPELLIVMLLYKILFGGKIIYDVIENYKANILYGDTYPKWTRPLLGTIVRTIEGLSKFWISHYFVAEKSYMKEMNFFKNNYTLLENKFKITGPVNSQLKTAKGGDRFRLIYSGTIAVHYGIMEAIALTDALFAIDNRIHLTIIGFASNNELMPLIKEEIKDKPYFEIIGGDVLVPHYQLLEAISNAHIGLVPYIPNKSTFNCIPTKIYEYMACKLPIILQHNPLWINLCDQYQAAIPIDYAAFDAKDLLKRCQDNDFYTKNQPMNIYWESEEKRLLTAIDHLIAS